MSRVRIKEISTTGYNEVTCINGSIIPARVCLQDTTHPGICESGKGGRREEVLSTEGKEPYSKVSTKTEVAI